MGGLAGAAHSAIGACFRGCGWGAARRGCMAGWDRAAVAGCGVAQFDRLRAGGGVVGLPTARPDRRLGAGVGDLELRAHGAYGTLFEYRWQVTSE